ncbi:MAG: CbaC protein [Natronomonas sp.]
MSRKISRVGLLVILAFLTPLIVELRTVAGFIGVSLSPTAYVGLAAAIVVVVLLAVALWNLHVEGALLKQTGET